MQNAVPVFISVCGSVSFQGSCERYKNAWLDGVRVLPLGMAFAPPPTFSSPLLPLYFPSPERFEPSWRGRETRASKKAATGNHWASKPFSGQSLVFLMFWVTANDKKKPIESLARDNKK